MTKILNNTTIGELIFDKTELFCVNSNTTVEEASRLMKEKNILSVPVWDADKAQYVGILDAFEIMRFATLGLFEENVFSDDLFSKFQFANETVGSLISKAPRSQRIVVFDTTDPVIAAVRALQQDHRALVRTKEGFQSTYRMLSQSDLIDFIDRNSADLKGIMDQRIEELGLANPVGEEVFAISANEMAARGFYHMFQKNLNAIGVLGLKGEMVGNLSASDLRGLNSKSLSNLQLPAMQFLQAMTGEIPPHPVTCPIGAHLDEVVAKMTAAKIHRVWVTNSAQKPLGLITATDVLRCFAPTESK
jgi:CBS domain-containing protein